MAGKTFTGETLSGEMARGSFPEVRRLMLDFVGEYLHDFEHAARSLGLTLAQARVLGYAAIKPSSMREIADQFGSDPSNITAKVDRLLQIGLVERLPDPDDGRVKLIAATPKGIELSATLCDSRAWLAHILGDLKPAEVDQVKGALELLLRDDDR